MTQNIQLNEMFELENVPFPKVV